jgi:hypothetical protein
VGAAAIWTGCGKAISLIAGRALVRGAGAGAGGGGEIEAAPSK